MLNSQDIINQTKENYNKIAKFFSDTRNRGWEELEYFKSLIKKGQNIMDWGCGNGRLLLMIGDIKVNYYGLDQSVELLKHAKKNFSEQVKSGKAKFFLTAKKQKRFPRDFFDLVFMVASFHHLPDKESRLDLLKRVHKQMKKNGRLIITVWNLESKWAKAKKDWEKIGDNDYLIPWKDSKGKIIVKRYYHHFSKPELRNLLIEAGFKIEKLDYFKKNIFLSDKPNSRNLVAVARPVK